MMFAIALVAFAVEGTIGFGSTLIVMSVGALVMPIDELLPAFVPLNIVLSATLLRRDIDWSALRRMAIPIAIGMAIGILLPITANVVVIGFGAFVILIAIWRLRGVTLPRLPVLLLGGLAHGLFGTGGPLIVYATPITDKTAFRSTLAVLWIALNTILLATIYRAPSTLTLEMGAAIVPGVVVGMVLHRKLDAARFERVVWTGLIVVGVTLVLRAAM
jgi:uncharacterized membrane protein YfcA